MVGRQTPFFALIVPFALVFMADGRRGIRAAWPAALTAGVVFALLQFATSNYISTQLTDIVASLGSAAAVVLLVQMWSPEAPGARRRGFGAGRRSPAAPSPTPRSSGARAPREDSPPEPARRSSRRSRRTSSSSSCSG